MDEHKLAIILCVNDERYYEECLYYIESQHLPEDMQIEIFPITDALSICSAYNQAMRITDARYKLYLHQDVFLLDKDLLWDSIKRFQSDEKLGMLGVLGASDIAKNRRFYRNWDLGNVLGGEVSRVYQNLLSTTDTSAAVLDGMYLMTQYDIEWDERITGWDFYDVSQSLRFQKAGYALGVMAKERPNCIHDCGRLNLVNYDHNFEEFYELYKEQLPEGDYEEEVFPQAYQQQYEIRRQLLKEWERLLELGEWEAVGKSVEQVWDERFTDTDQLILKWILSIEKKERKYQEYKAQCKEERFAKMRDLKN